MLPSSYLEKWGELDRTACTLRTLGGWALVAILVCSYCSVLLLHQTWWRGERQSPGFLPHLGVAHEEELLSRQTQLPAAPGQGHTLHCTLLHSTVLYRLTHCTVLYYTLLHCTGSHTALIANLSSIKVL